MMELTAGSAVNDGNIITVFLSEISIRLRKSSASFDDLFIFQLAAIILFILTAHRFNVLLYPVHTEYLFRDTHRFFLGHQASLRHDGINVLGYDYGFLGHYYAKENRIAFCHHAVGYHDRHVKVVSLKSKIPCDLDDLRCGISLRYDYPVLGLQDLDYFLFRRLAVEMNIERIDVGQRMGSLESKACHRHIDYRVHVMRMVAVGLPVYGIDLRSLDVVRIRASPDEKAVHALDFEPFLKRLQHAAEACRVAAHDTYEFLVSGRVEIRAGIKALAYRVVFASLKYRGLAELFIKRPVCSAFPVCRSIYDYVTSLYHFFDSAPDLDSFLLKVRCLLGRNVNAVAESFGHLGVIIRGVF